MQSRDDKLLQQLGFDKNAIRNNGDDAVSSDDDTHDHHGSSSSSLSSRPYDARLPSSSSKTNSFSVHPPVVPPSSSHSKTPNQLNSITKTALSYASPSTTASLARSLGGTDNAFGGGNGTNGGFSSSSTVTFEQYQQLQQSYYRSENERKQLENRIESISTFSKSQMGLLRKAMIKQLRDKDTVMDDILKRVGSTNPSSALVPELSALVQKSRTATDTAEKSTEKIAASLSTMYTSPATGASSSGSSETVHSSMTTNENSRNYDAEILSVAKENNEYKDKIQQYTMEKEFYVNQEKELQSTITQLQHQIATLEQQHHQRTKSSASSVDETTTKNVSMETVTKLQKEIDEQKIRYENQLKEHQTNRHHLDEQIHAYEIQVTELEERIRSITLTNEKTNQTESLTKDITITELQNKVKTQNDELIQLRTDLSSLQSSFTTLQETSRTEITNLKQQHATDIQQLKVNLTSENSSSLTRVTTLEQERNTLQEQLQQNQDTITKLTTEITELRTSLDTTKTNAKAREEKIKTTAKSQFEDLKTRFVGELEGKTKELTDMTTRYEALQNEYNLHHQQHQNQMLQLQKELQQLKRLSTSSLWSVLVEQIKVLKNQQLLLKNQLKDQQHQWLQYMQENALRVQEKCSVYKEVYNNLVVRYKKEFAERKRIFNELQELRGNIRVYCRVRPVLPFEEEKGSPVCTKFPAEGEITVINNKKQIKTWEFDQVFTPQVTNDGVFREVEGLITSAIDGYHVCIFAYGQTGSGKTFTMEGSSSSPGINYRTIDSIFNCINERTETKYEIAISMLEIYNETLRDMLLFTNNNNSSSTSNGSTNNSKNSDYTAPKLVIRSNNNGTYVPDLTIRTVTNREQVLDLLRNGYANRATFATNMNEHSSRSHCIFTLYVTGTNSLTNTVTKGRLHLIDLAGSERISKSGAVGDRLKEAQAINTSLSALGDVIQARGEKRNHIPFRNSTLTLFLSESLSGDSKTLMFVNLSPILSNAEETFCSLNFAARARAVELGKASKHTGKASNVPMNNGEEDETQEE